jgi:hypothetical protein
MLMCAASCHVPCVTSASENTDQTTAIAGCHYTVLLLLLLFNDLRGDLSRPIYFASNSPNDFNSDYHCPFFFLEIRGSVLSPERGFPEIIFSHSLVLPRKCTFWKLWCRENSVRKVTFYGLYGWGSILRVRNFFSFRSTSSLTLGPSSRLWNWY